ncbi:BaeS Signal transduction histidine kinase [Rhabdaerophilaceae bacterium]
MAILLKGPTDPRSLAGRLFLSAVLLSVLVLVTAGLILSAINRRSVEAAFDERLKLYLKVLVADVAALSDGSAVEPGNLGEPQFQLPLSGWYWQVMRLDLESNTAAILRTSRSLFSQRLPLLVEPGTFSARGDFRDGYRTGPEGRRIRIVEQEIDLGENNRFVIVVAGNADDMIEDRQRFDFALLLILSLLGLALGGSAYIQVRYGLRPLRELSQSLAQVRNGEREHVQGQFPVEVAPLAVELNQLLDVNREIVSRARAQVGNLAHALKTPLSVLLNEAKADNGGLGDKIREQTAIMRDQVQYYLDRARAAARAATIGNIAEVEPVLAAFVRTFEKIYHDRHLIFATKSDPGVRFRGEKQDLEEIIGNLVDNAGKWAKSRVEISAEYRPASDQATAQLILTVDDDGPGLPEEKRKEAIKRGRRLDETKPGSGLGLSIVLDLATLYGGSLALEESPLGGLRARLALPSL